MYAGGPVDEAVYYGILISVQCALFTLTGDGSGKASSLVDLG